MFLIERTFSSQIKPAYDQLTREREHTVENVHSRLKLQHVYIHRV